MSNTLKNRHEEVFVARIQQLGLQTQSHENTPEFRRIAGPRLLFNDIAKAACLPHLTRSQQALKLINQSLALRAQYKWVINKISVSYSPSQAAASTDLQVNERMTEHFSLRLKPDPISEDQVYAIVEVQHATDAQQQLGVHLHCQLNDAFYVVSFGPLMGNKTQQLLDTNSLAYEYLSDPETSLFLT